jgi:hypothetical protein
LNSAQLSRDIFNPLAKTRKTIVERMQLAGQPDINPLFILTPALRHSRFGATTLASRRSASPDVPQNKI